MACPLLVFYLKFFFLWKIAQANSRSTFVSVERGDNLTLPCFYKGDVAARYYWYKQTSGQKPRLISSFYVYERNGTFYDEFKNDPRFMLDIENGRNHLMIKDLQTSDSATYYCISCFLYKLEFSVHTIVNVKGSGLNIQALVHQSASETIQSGQSVNLSCIVQAGTSDEKHSVYWFKNSEESDPELIYTHGDRTDQCERKPNTQTHTCVYYLSIKNITVSHAGTYYCAVASCGHILFGNGTKLDFEDEVHVVYGWHRALLFTTILSVLLSVSLAFSLCVMTKRSSCQSTEYAPSTANAKGYHHTENLYYAAVSVNLTNSTQRDQTWSECVYYSIKK